MARRTKEEAEATRTRLLDAALQVFNEKGVAGASLAEVAAVAGVTRGAIYWHFRDKPALLDALIQRTVLPFETAFERSAANGSGGALSRLLDVLRLVLKTIMVDKVAQSVFILVLFKVAYVGDVQTMRTWRIESIERFTKHIEDALQSAAMEMGLPMHIPFHQAARGVRAVFDGILLEWLLCQGTAFDLESEGISALEVHLRGLGLGQENNLCKTF